MAILLLIAIVAALLSLYAIVAWLANRAMNRRAASRRSTWKDD